MKCNLALWVEHTLTATHSGGERQMPYQFSSCSVSKMTHPLNGNKLSVLIRLFKDLRDEKVTLSFPPIAHHTQIFPRQKPTHRHTHTQSLRWWWQMTVYYSFKVHHLFDVFFSFDSFAYAKARALCHLMHSPHFYSHLFRNKFARNLFFLNRTNERTSNFPWTWLRNHPKNRFIFACKLHDDSFDAHCTSNRSRILSTLINLSLLFSSIQSRKWMATIAKEFV